MLRSEKGITLVALVVTIVVLIILATISISVAVNGGLIGKTQEAKNFYENADLYFNEQDQNFTKYVDAYLQNATYKAPTTTPSTPAENATDTPTENTTAE